ARFLDTSPSTYSVKTPFLPKLRHSTTHICQSGCRFLSGRRRSTNQRLLCLFPTSFRLGCTSGVRIGCGHCSKKHSTMSVYSSWLTVLMNIEARTPRATPSLNYRCSLNRGIAGSSQPRGQQAMTDLESNEPAGRRHTWQS